MMQPFWRTEFLERLNTELLVGIYSRDMGTDVHTKTCTKIFIAALFMLVLKWKQPKCSSTEEWIQHIFKIH